MGHAHTGQYLRKLTLHERTQQRLNEWPVSQTGSKRRRQTAGAALCRNLPFALLYQDSQPLALLCQDSQPQPLATCKHESHAYGGHRSEVGNTADFKCKLQTGTDGQAGPGQPCLGGRQMSRGQQGQYCFQLPAEEGGLKSETAIQQGLPHSGSPIP